MTDSILYAGTRPDEKPSPAAVVAFKKDMEERFEAFKNGDDYNHNEIKEGKVPPLDKIEARFYIIYQDSLQWVRNDAFLELVKKYPKAKFVNCNKRIAIKTTKFIVPDNVTKGIIQEQNGGYVEIGPLFIWLRGDKMIIQDPETDGDDEPLFDKDLIKYQDGNSLIWYYPDDITSLSVRVNYKKLIKICRKCDDDDEDDDDEDDDEDDDIISVPGQYLQ